MMIIGSFDGFDMDLKSHFFDIVEDGTCIDIIFTQSLLQTAMTSILIENSRSYTSKQNEVEIAENIGHSH